MRLIHISDLHFHRNPTDNREANDLLKTIEDRYPAHGIVVTGDITDDGHPQQYVNAYEALKPFKGKVFIAPGNHDFGAAGNFYSSERARRFDEMLSIPLEQGGTFTGDSTPVVHVVREGEARSMLIALDTNLETDHPFDFACGEVGGPQLSALDAILSNPANAGFTKILFFHHHLFEHNNPFMELKDAKAVMRTIYHRVDVVLFGHRHVMGRWENSNGIRFLLASDNSPGKDWVREIVMEDGTLTVNDLSVKPNNKRARGKRGGGMDP